MDTEPTPSIPATAIVYRCIQCGIESREVTCFVGIAPKGPQRYPVKCITCSQPPTNSGHLQKFFALAGAIFVPVLFLAALRGKTAPVSPALAIAACLMLPAIVILHELGHVLTARLLHLEVSLVTFGVGPKLWSGRIAGIRIRVHAWLLMALTYLGSRSMRFLRLRVWITVLMGPAINIILIAAAVMLWDPLTRWFGANGVLLWVIYNAILVIGNLVPHRLRQFGHAIRNDGLQLLQIPFKKRDDLGIYLSATPIVSSLELYNDSDYAGAREICLRGLSRLPGNPALTIMISACHINLGDYESARAVIEPMLDSSAALSPHLCATIKNNLAIALWLRDFNAADRHESLPRADSLTAEAFASYPCALAHRSTRALILASTERPQEALGLLDYVNYERGSPDNRANREIARAFALRQLNRNEEAQHALNLGLKSVTARHPWLTTIGLLPATDAA